MDIEIYGNSRPRELLSGMITKGKEPHSIMVYGEQGLGKKAMANYIAAALMCKEKNGVPCGKCKSCKMMKDGVHPDFTVANANANGNYIVDESIRPIVYDSVIKPNEGDFKVYVIPDLDMSVNTSVQAQNILLKVIEEPPAHTVIILTARNKESFLPTIISRTISFGMVRVSAEESEKYLRKNFPDKPDTEIISAVKAGKGNIGRCRAYLEKNSFYFGVINARKIAKAFSEGSEYELLKVLTEICGKKDSFREGLKLFSEIVRDSSIIRSGGKTLISCGEDFASVIAGKYPATATGRLYDILMEYIRKLDSNCNSTLTANSLAGKMCEL